MNLFINMGLIPVSGKSQNKEQNIKDIQSAIITLQENKQDVTVAAISKITGITVQNLYHYDLVQPFVRKHTKRGPSKTKAADDYAAWKKHQDEAAIFERLIVQQELLEMEHNAKVQREKATASVPFCGYVTGQKNTILVTMIGNQVMNVSDCNRQALRGQTDMLLALFPGASIKVYDEQFTFVAVDRKAS
ncbi:MAG: hypothetical protein C4294_18680 [Nitrospiraceae bacterium]